MHHTLNIENLLTCQRKSVKVKGMWRTVIGGGSLAIQVEESRSTVNANTTGEPSATFCIPPKRGNNHHLSMSSTTIPGDSLDITAPLVETTIMQQAQKMPALLPYKEKSKLQGIQSFISIHCFSKRLCVYTYIIYIVCVLYIQR